MPIDIPTMFVVNIALCLTLSLSIGWVAAKEGHDGLRPLILALALHALAYALYALRGRIPDLWSIFVANMAVTGGYALVALAIATFQRRRVLPLLLWLPVLLFAFALGAFSLTIVARVAVSSAVYIVQDMILLWLLLAGTKHTVGRGQHLIIAGVGLNLLIMVYRGIIALSDASFITRLSDPGTPQTLVYLSAFVSLNLLAIGFILMSKEAADEKTRLMAMTDKLTGCWNRFRIEEVGQYEMRRLQRYATPVSLILIDLDHFKSVNDEHGHGVGDLILQGFAATAQACIRSTDVLARWGGEEFVVLLPASGTQAAADTAERIRRAVASSVYGDGVRITASFGFSSYRSTDRWEEWVQRADQALYEAKAQGRNRVVAEMSTALESDRASQSAGLLRVVWRDAYGVGDKKIDAEHRVLFERCNALINAMLNGTPKDAVAAQIGDFVAFTAKHIRGEEEALARCAYPDRVAHCARHRQLLERADLLSERYALDELAVGELLHFLVYELTAQHMLIEDRKFAAYLAGGD